MKPKPKKRSEYLSDFLDFLEATRQEYTFAVDGLRQEDERTQDILHAIELGDYTYQMRCKLGTELKLNRQARRSYKDIIEESEVILEYMKEHKKALDMLTQILGKVRKQENYHANRTYRPRVRK